MAKIKTEKIDVTGISVDDILQFDKNDLDRMNESELRAYSTRLMSAMNKRIKRLGKTEMGQDSPAYQDAKELPMGKFSVNFHNIPNEKERVKRYKETIKQMQDWSKRESSTISGWKKKNIEIKKQIGFEVDYSQMKRFWELYRKFRKENASTYEIFKMHNYDSTAIRNTLGAIFETMIDIDVSDEEMRGKFDAQMEMLYNMITTGEQNWDKYAESIWGEEDGLIIKNEF